MQLHKIIPLSMIAVFAISAENSTQAELNIPNEIKVEYKRVTKDADIAVKQISSSDTASLLSDAPGVSIASGGSMSNIPAVHGLADDRLKITVDGMPLTCTCPNHMNTPLSYIDPKRVETIAVTAGIAPVSMGGDNIGGVISVESDKPKFAEKGKGFMTSGELTGFFRSNNVNRGAFLSVTGATENFSFNYSGSNEKAKNYEDGHGDTIKATLFEQRNQFVTTAFKTENGVITAQLGQQTVPYQGYVNEYMDMLSDSAAFGNLSYLGYIGDKVLEAKAYWKNAKHYMNKIISERWNGTGAKPNMPMYTSGVEYGYDVKLDIPLSNVHTVKIGQDYKKYTLNDWWPPVSTTVPGGMAPNAFWNINDGKREILGAFAESNYRWSDRLTSNIGARISMVSMDTGNVQGYNNGAGSQTTPATVSYTAASYNDPVDATNFNNLGHSKRDINIDITAFAQYKHSSTNDLELGFARKVRSPNIHERYTWAGGYGATINGPIAMDMAMINWFGDGNGYVGNVNLKPEVAYTVSASSAWHDVSNKEWNIKVTPYYTIVKDYIDADWKQKATAGGYNNINLYQFANHDAVLFGADVSANAKVWDNGSLGKGIAKTVIGYTRGYRTDASGSGLYHIMPLHAKITLEQEVGSWTNAIDINSVASKKSVDNNRKEPETAGYTLVDIRTNYKWSKMVTVDFAITNLFDKGYDLPLGGVNVIGTDSATYAKGSYIPLTGQGRSVNTAVTIKF